METLSNQSTALAELHDNQGTPAFSALREVGWHAFIEQGWPTRKNEEYKFTALDQLIPKKFDFERVLNDQLLNKSLVESKFYAIDGYHLVFDNGEYRPDLSTIPSEELLLTSFENLDAAAVINIVGFAPDNRASVALNQAFLGNGLLIQVSKSSTPLPVFIYHFNGGSDASMGFPRIHIHAEENVQLKCYEKSFNSANANFTSSVLTVDMAANAQVRFTKIQTFGKSDVSLDNMIVRQAANSHFFANTYSFSGSLIRNNVEIAINGEHAEANMYGLYLLDGNAHVDNHTVVDHKVPNCNSNELYKGIVDENAVGVFNGKIFVRQPAQKTNAFQANNNILLSDTATIHTKPQLEIWADDVKCSHGCTVGQMDEEALFYLRSRGIRPDAAKAMLLNAFAKETLANVQSPEIIAEVTDLIHNRLIV